MTDESSMQSYYAARAPEYDAVYRKAERQADLRAIEAWLPTRFEGGRRLLEIACGTGYWTQFLARSASGIVAVDTAPETLAIAAGRVPPDVVRFVLADAYALPLAPAAFDGAFAGFWFSHVPRHRQREFLTRLGSPLRPGARVVLLDNRYVEGSSSRITRRDAEGNTFQSRTLADGSMHEVLKNFPTPDELVALVEGLGVAAKVEHWPHYWALEYCTKTS